MKEPKWMKYADITFGKIFPLSGVLIIAPIFLLIMALLLGLKWLENVAAYSLVVGCAIAFPLMIGCLIAAMFVGDD